ncbi:hypothetical protein [Nostoc sp. CHAB 5715]|uniref:hypothetical protein n=1 Tax=Nostoc sp. CHAB 5715 TaxID=2780400 RepID=UPI001E315262|nr:hypothetical protein [Nostoc sp. CHAB 5715]MCC5620713.1 hypothetical protein [Nostoc sp. CHAB 5715]
MLPIIDPKVYKEMGKCFYLLIPVCNNDAEFEALMSDAEKVSEATKKMLDGSIDIEDLLETVEPSILSMDDYIEEIEKNLEEALIKVYKY